MAEPPESPHAIDAARLEPRPRPGCRANEYGLDPKRIGTWGLSAGGPLASTAATHFDAGHPDAADPIERVSCRPDFLILAYPVVSMESPPTHAGSRRNLIGTNPDPK